MPSVIRNIPAARPRGSPPAVWEAYLRVNAWKTWVIFALLLANFLLVLVALRLAVKPTEVVVEAPDGVSTYVERGAGTEALLRFLAEQKGAPSDVAIVRFTKDFLELALAINSSTVEYAWPDALARMSSDLRARVLSESAATKLVETTKLASVKTTLVIEDVSVVTKTDKALHVRATVSRKKASLSGEGADLDDRVQVDLVNAIVPRTVDRPYGLEVADFRLEVLPAVPTKAAP